jgi:RNA polymerase sigma-70 factor (ECF subfamily)
MTDDGPFRLASDEEFIRRFGSVQCALHGFILGMVYSKADADDLLQEVNLALWKKRDAYDSRCDFLHWAVGFARIEVNNLRKKYGKSRVLFSDNVLDSLASDWPSNAALDEQRLDALTRCLKKLDPKEHHFVAEFYQRDVSIQDLAKASNIPASTIYKILNRARESLRRCVRLTVAQSEHPV